jgi:hypothetical protein
MVDALTVSPLSCRRRPVSTTSLHARKQVVAFAGMTWWVAPVGQSFRRLVLLITSRPSHANDRLPPDLWGVWKRR